MCSLSGLRAWRAGFLAAAVALLFACGGGGGSSAAPEPISQGGGSSDELGTLFVGLTDAEGDFVSYSVDVVSLNLTRANGDIVSALPTSTRVDFTELTEVTEFLTVATVPVGNYERAELVLDFSSADIVVQNEAGESVAANAVDPDGNPLGVWPVELQLHASDAIRVRPGAPAAFSLDFDLDASNTINLDVVPALVTVEPFVLATPELEEDRAHRARGVLNEVVEDESLFTLNVRPFRHRAGEFGTVRIQTDDATSFEVDGEVLVGSDGLAAMAALPERTPVIAGVSVSEDGLLAQTVLAGTSVPWTDGDVVRGVVSAREGNAVTVSGARVEYADGAEVFRGTFTVLVGDNTGVSSRLGDALGHAAVSVGARITAFGELVDDETVDASEGRVRLSPNQLTAEVVAAAPLAVQIYHLNGRRAAAFDFSGTGITAGDDADPAFYEIATGALDLATVETGDLLRVRGYVRDFGAAPEDYDAYTVVDVATEQRPATLKVGWTGGSDMPFTATAPERLDLDLTEARVSLKQRGVPMGFNEPLEALALVAPEGGRGIYAIQVRGGGGEAHLYRTFSDLSAALVAALDEGQRLHRLTTHGRYNRVDGTFTTGRASFVFEAASQ